MKTISFQVDDETFLLLDHARENEGNRLGLGKISKSLYLRRVIAASLGDPRDLFTQGYLEGYRAAFAAALRTIATSLEGIAVDPSKVPGLGLGMSSPYEGWGQK